MDKGLIVSGAHKLIFSLTNPHTYRTVPSENNEGSREIIFSVNFFSWFQDRTGTINISPDTSH